MERRHTDIVTVVKVWAYSFGVTIILALVYFLLSKITVRWNNSVKAIYSL
jgi:hypothetical protein